jgi:hypothetical protein
MVPMAEKFKWVIMKVHEEVKQELSVKVLRVVKHKQVGLQVPKPRLVELPEARPEQGQVLPEDKLRLAELPEDRLRPVELLEDRLKRVELQVDKLRQVELLEDRLRPVELQEDKPRLVALLVLKSDRQVRELLWKVLED